MAEIWKDINNYEGHYQISNFGNVRSIKFGKIKNLATRKRKDGYLDIRLRKNDRKNFLVHRLVAEAFVNNNNGHKFVNHKNGIKSDNHFNNLEWCTKSQNCKHAAINGLYKNRLDYSQAKEIRKKYKQKGVTQKDLALEYGVTRSNISYITSNKTF